MSNINMDFKYIDGGVCAPAGFKAGGIHAGMRKNKAKKDLALIVSDRICSAAGAFTVNKAKGAPVIVSQKHMENGRAQAIICNSGNANTCAANGMELALEVCSLTGDMLGIEPENVIVASTGVIGQEMNMEPFRTGIPPLVQKLSYGGSKKAAQAILTLDKAVKELAVEFEIGGRICRLGGIAKGSGMIHPNMATMLCFITTDLAISSQMLQKALSEDVVDTFNQISVDGDTSTNDMAVILANGMAGNPEISEEGEEYYKFCRILHQVNSAFAKAIAKDGEGATKMMECRVSGAPSKEAARAVSKSVISSTLFKTALFAGDANWGRAICAIGYAKGEFDIKKVDISLASERGRVMVCKGAAHYPYSEDMAAEILGADEVDILIDMNQGEEKARAWGCDLTYEYVKMNGSYRKS